MKLCAIHLNFIVTLCQLKALNILRLTHIYNGVCGGNSDCERDDFIEDNRAFLSKYGTYCIPCSCSSNCVISGNCCPNVFFELQLSCIDTRLLRFNRNLYSELSVLMINKCPKNADHKIIKRCESVQTLEDKLSYTPVTSTRNNLTYTNIYCAHCFNESESNLNSWRLQLVCEEFADLNFATSHKEIVDLADARKCNINYYQIQGYSRNCTAGENNFITKCNISGTWETFDPDIEFACETYDNQFRFFKNVFCYICNSPGPDVTLISRCNVTGLWDIFDQELEHSCLNSISSNVTMGFKNVYCYLCNRKNATSMDELKYNVAKEESMSKTHDFLFTYKINHFSNQLLQKRAEQILSNTLNPRKYTELNPFMETKQRDGLNIKIPENISNVTNFFSNYFANQGTVDICINKSGTCNCTERCYFKYYKRECCIEKMFYKSTACTDRNLTIHGEGSLVYDSCKNKSYIMFYKLCYEDMSSDLFSILPVQKKVSQGYLRYKNIYCAIYHENVIPIADILFWEIHITCTVYIPFVYHASFEEYLDFIQNHGCNVSFLPPRNMTQSQSWRSTLVFCKFTLCVFRPWSGGESEIVTTRPSPTFRRMYEHFISLFPTETRNQQISRSCNSSQVYYPFKDECRDIHCHTGRYLSRDECIPLVQTSHNLGYTWSFGLKSVTKKNVSNTAAFLQAVEKNIQSFVREYLELKLIVFESSDLFSNMSCMVPTNWINDTNIIITVYQKIFIPEIVNRPLIESKLFNLSNNILNVPYDHSVYEFIIYNDNNEFNLQQYILRFPKPCSRTSFNNEFPEANKYVHMHVSKLLFCKQVELKEEDMNSLKLCQTSSICEIHIDEYNITAFKRARICLKDFETFSLARIRENSKSQQILGIIMLICTLISLFCLFITFITYCVLPSLQTLPGKNNMCLVLAMFISHLLFQFGISANHTTIGCKIIGILLHYFWLSTFGCFNVCSLHMYRVFRSQTRLCWSSNKSQNRILKKYMIYAFGIPALIISVNIAITFTTSKFVGYGGHICFLNKPKAVVVTFIIPVTLVCTSNIYFFIATSLKIASSAKVESEEQLSSFNRVQFAVYIKLFTLTGITWIFQILDSFLPMSEFSTVVSLMNSLQGVFIFTAYICNKRVLYLWKQSKTKNGVTSPKNRSHLSVRTLKTSCV